MQLVLCYALGLFCFCLGIHIFIWRMFPARRQGARLIAIFSVGAVLLFGIFVLASGGFSSVDWPSWGLAFLLHFSLSGAYLGLYTGLVSFSPSIAIAKRLEASMPHGLAQDKLAPPWFTDDKLGGARLENLLATGFIYQSGGLLRLTSRGRIIVRCLRLFRNILGLPETGKG
jgi:hypothetical protein